MFKGVWHVSCDRNLNFVAEIDEIPLYVGCKIAVPRFGCKEPYHRRIGLYLALPTLSYILGNLHLMLEALLNAMRL